MTVLRERATSKTFSVIIPVYNECNNIGPVYDALSEAAASTPELAWEFAFIDDGSTDGSFALLSRLSESDPRVKVVRLSRNFGSQTAVTAGLHFVSGDATVIIACDLQDHPREILRLIEKWREGFHVVWGVRATRRGHWLDKATLHFARAIIQRIALPNFPAGGVGVFLMDRLVVDALNGMPEPNRMTVGLALICGFRQTNIYYHRLERHSGASKWSLGQRIRLMIDIVVSFSMTPIRVASLVGFCTSLLSLIYIVYMIVDRLLYKNLMPGWTTTVVLVAFLGGLQLFTLGILGEYLWRVLDSVRKRPLYLVLETRGAFPRYLPPLPPHAETVSSAMDLPVRTTEESDGAR